MNKFSKLVKYCVLIALTMVAIESMSYFYFVTKTDQLSFSNPEFYTFTEQQIILLAKIYHREIGWHSNNKTEHGERNRGELARINKAPYYALAFGDSYTYGIEVSEKQTWPYKLELISNRAVLNFGGPGYGIDQIYWAFEEKISRLNSKYVIFGFITDDLKRARTNYWRFNHHAKDIIPILTKPLYKWNGTEYQLVPNPIQSIEELPNLLETQFILELMDADPERSKKLNPSFSFPFSKLLVSDFIWKEMLSDRLETIWGNAENRALLKFILEKYSKTAISKNSIPIVVLFPDYDMLDAHRKNKKGAEFAAKSFFDICKDLNLKCLFPLEVFKEDKPASSFFKKDGHYNEATNTEIARVLQEFLLRIEKENSTSH